MTSTLPLHMYIRPLTLEDTQQLIDLEAQGFPPSERASPQSVEFRLNACPELCSGLFIRQFSNDTKELQSERLIGHIMGTKVSRNGYIRLEDMSPSHNESSDTVAIHSLVIDPNYQKKNLATLLLTDYIQKLSNQEIGERIVIIAHEPLIPFYERVGFKVHGENRDVIRNPDFAGSTWFDMVRELVKEEYDN